MKLSIDFLKLIGHTDKVYVRCLSPKLTPLTELEARGMTYKDKANQTKKSTVNGYIDLETGVFYRRYGKNYKPVTDGWGHLKELNRQGYGVYFVVGHGGEKNDNITHGSTLFHESDRATLEQQQLEIDRITQEFGKPTAVVKTKKSLHSYWASTEIIPLEKLATYQRRWSQYSKCDDNSLDDAAQLMRLPGFDHVAWNSETQDFDRIECQLLQLNKVSYSLEQFDRILPPLDVDRWCKKSLEVVESDADDRDMRTLAQYLPGYDNSGGKWIKAKCPAHGGESSDSLHIDSQTGGFICHAGCSSSSVYNAAKSDAVAAGHRFEVAENANDDLRESIAKALDLKNCEAPNLYGGNLGRLLKQTARNFNERVEIFNFISIPVLASRIKSETCLLVNPGSGFVVKPVRWCGLVGSTGTMKSPILNTVMRPLNHQQNEIWKEHQYKTEVYDQELKAYEKLSKDEKKGTDEPKPPKQMKSEYFIDFTIEGLTAAIADYPDEGTVIYSDELAGFFSSMDAYKSSAGVDRPKWLSIWDGGAIKSTRRNGSSYVPHSSISIVGGIQPGIIEQLIKKDKSKSDGLWARFTFMRIDYKLTSLFSDIDGSLDDTLREVYDRLAQEPPQQHTIDIKARPLCSAWHEFLQQKMKDEGENNPLMVGVYAKMIGITFRNALILHRVYAAIVNTVPTQTIPVGTIETAIGWTKFEMNQTLLEYQMLGLTDDDDPELARILKFIHKFGGDTWLADRPDGWVSPRDVARWWFPKATRKSDNIRKFMLRVVELDHAISIGESQKLKIKIITEKSADKADKMAVNEDSQGSQPLSDKPTFSAIELTEPIHINVSASKPTKHNNKPTLADKNGEDTSVGGVDSENVGFVGLDVGFVGVLADTLINGDSDDSDGKNVGLIDNGLNNIHSNASSENVGFVGLISEVNIKIGDRIEFCNEIATVETVDGNNIGCRYPDDSYTVLNVSTHKFKKVTSIDTQTIPEATEDDGY